MLGLPKATEIRKIIPKKAIYQTFKTELTSDKRAKFDADISKIILVNELSARTLNLPASDSKPIFALNILLKRKDYDKNNIITIAKLFQQKLLLILQCEDEAQLAIYQTKLINNAWQKISEQKINIEGLNLHSIWENLVIQIGEIELKAENTLDEQIKADDERAKLISKIEALKKKMKITKQPRKKFEINQEIKALQKKLD